MKMTKGNGLNARARCLACCLLVVACCVPNIVNAQNQERFEKIVRNLASSKFQGRGYARNGVRKACKYIESEYRKSGVDEVSRQSFTIDINTFPGKMKMSVDGKKLMAGTDFVVREYSPGGKGEYGLYYVDTLNYDSARIFADLNRPENKGVFVVCDFWFTYKHSKDFRKLESRDGAPNSGVIYVWDTPLKFYKAYGEKVSDKPIIWVSSDFNLNSKQVSIDIDNKFFDDYATDNVIAKVEGQRPDSCYVFTAHYDHLGNMGKHLFFPGANDNASGTASIITLAEYYARNRPEFDTYFLSFSGEEAGLRGSIYFVEHPTIPLDRIKYLFNLDMVGDDNRVQYCEVSNPGMEGFERMQKINDDKGYFLSLHLGELAANSDHWPFAEKNVPCIMFENESGSAFPFYHTAQDNCTTAFFGTYAPIFRLVTDFIGK